MSLFQAGLASLYCLRRLRPAFVADTKTGFAHEISKEISHVGSKAPITGTWLWPNEVDGEIKRES